ncbi:hypothetical protein [Bosea sp. 117]|uniref:hypothetical protein n=1 Tax=Bosea sp. 117 TaxID=1125973 RepID=UPI000494BA61|nr:hypothetical protein [Bosea sp. 117]
MNRWLCLSATVALAGCTSVDVRRVTDPDQTGIRYWRPQVLLVKQQTTDKEGNRKCEFATLTLPDRSEEYAININAGLGSANVTPELHDGWRLDKMAANLDSQTDENLNAVANLVKAAGSLTPKASGVNRAGGAAPECIGVYRIVYDETGGIKGFAKLSDKLALPGD